MYSVVLFYKYIKIDDTQKLKDEQLYLAEDLNLKGRMIIAEEGVNGTFEGTNDNIDKYIKEMQKDARFNDVDFKLSVGDGNSFPKLSIKIRKEIVTSHFEDKIDPTKDTGKYLEPDELHCWYEEGKEFNLVDMRNSYEYVSGHFEGAIDPGTEAFRELPDKISNLEDIKNKPVVTVCTGGVRCEKASALLKEKGFKDVYQLKGGIHRYIEKYPNGHFKGALYVFDGRVTMDMAPKEKRSIVGKCEFCGEHTESYADDDSVKPSRQVLCCEKCFNERKDLRPASPELKRQQVINSK